MTISRLVALLLIATLAACAPRGQLAMIATAPGVEHDIFVVTSRARIEDSADFGAGRDPVPTYGLFRVAVPPTHRPGTVSWPDGTPDPATDFAVTSAALSRDPGAFRTALGGAASRLPAGGREAVIFVHGYNTNFAEGLYRFTQMTHDFEAPGLAILYSWPSAARPGDYLYDRDSVLFARQGLERLIDTIQASGVETVTIVAHSLGSELVVETLRTRAVRRGALWPKLGAVALISPDIDIDLFRAQAAEIGPLPQPFIVFSSARDRALRLSEWLSGSREKLGAVDDLATLAELKVTVIDTTAATRRGDLHMAAVNSPWIIQVVKGLRSNRQFALDRPEFLASLPIRVVAYDNALGLVLAPPRGP